jgi:hypothetical protein
MEYNELITRVQQAPVEVPGTEALLQGMHRTLQRRQKQRQWAVSMFFVLVVGATIALLPSATPAARPITLAEQVSRQIDVPRSNTPAPLIGYRNSIHNRQIYTLL